MAIAPARRSSTLSRSNMAPLPPRANIPVMIDQYMIADPRKAKSDHEKDYVEGFLLADVPEHGLVAEMSPEGEPLTRVKVMMPMPREGGTRRRDILALSKPKSGGPAIDQGGIAVFEKAYFDKKDGFIKANFSRGLCSGAQRQEQLNAPFLDILVCVRPEDYIESKKQFAGRVDVLMADTKMVSRLDTDGRELLENDADFESPQAKLAFLVDDLVARSVDNVGNPGFMLLARQLAPKDASAAEAANLASDPNTRQGGFSVARRIKTGEGDDAVYTPETAEQLLARFGKENANLLNFVGQPDWQVEFVPMIAVNQATTLVPSKGEPGKEKDNSTIYGIYGVVPEGPDGAHARHVQTDATGVRHGMIDCGWMPSHVMCARKEATSDIWYSTYQNGTGARLDVDSVHDVRTPITPDYHLAAIRAEAARNVEGKKAYYAAKAPVEEPTVDASAPAPGR